MKKKAKIVNEEKNINLLCLHTYTIHSQQLFLKLRKNKTFTYRIV